MFAGWKVQPWLESGWSTLHDTKNCPAVRNTLYSNIYSKFKWWARRFKSWKVYTTHKYIHINILRCICKTYVQHRYYYVLLGVSRETCLCCFSLNPNLSNISKLVAELVGEWCGCYPHWDHQEGSEQQVTCGVGRFAMEENDIDTTCGRTYMYIYIYIPSTCEDIYIYHQIGNKMYPFTCEEPIYTSWKVEGDCHSH